MRAPRELSSSAFDAVSSDVRHVVLAVLAVVVIGQAQTPSMSLVLLACVVAGPDLLRRHDLVPELLAAATALIYWASIAWSAAPSLSGRVAADQIIMAGLFIAYRLALTDRRAMLLVGSGYLIGCLVLVRRLLVENAGADLALESAGVRYTIEGVNQNFVAFSLCGGVAVAVLLTKVAPRAAHVWIVGGMLCWAGVLLTDTRAALVAVAMVVVWWVLGFRRFRHAGLRVLWIGVGVVAIGILTGWADGLLQRLVPVDIERDAGGLNGRLDFWPYARSAFWDEPLFGLGAGAITQRLPGGVFAHNVILDIGTSVGVVGLLVFGAFVLSALWRTTADAEPALRCLLAGVVLCALAAPLLTGYWYQAAPVWLLLALFSRVGVMTWRSDTESCDEATARRASDSARRAKEGRAGTARSD